MHAQTSSSQIIASIGKDRWERLRAGFVQGGWSALARFVPAAILASAVASSPTLAADMPQAGRCTVGPGATALLKQVQLRPAMSATDIVFTFEGNRIPQPRLRYVTLPILQDPSGNPVQIAGSSFLEINMQPASGVDLSGPQVRQVYRGPQRIPGPPGSTLRELVQTGDFEAVLTWVAGLTGQQPYSVRTACRPARLVVHVGR